MVDRGTDNDDSFGLPNGHYGNGSQTDEDDTKHLEVAFCGGSNSSSSAIRTDDVDNQEYFQQPNTCRILQRKLELKVEKAKRNYNQYQEDICTKKSQSSSLIPINRLQIPGASENQPLVDYKSESDDQEEVSFFPLKPKSTTKQELSDTFSIQEMTIESDNSDDSDISQNLELLPPRLKINLVDRVLSCFYCVHGKI